MLTFLSIKEKEEKNMTKKEMVDLLTSKTGVEKYEVEKVLEGTIELILEEAKKAPVRISGLGTFKITNKKEKVAKNPKTGELVKVPARNVLTFKASESNKNL